MPLCREAKLSLVNLPSVKEPCKMICCHKSQCISAWDNDFGSLCFRLPKKKEKVALSLFKLERSFWSNCQNCTLTYRVNDVYELTTHEIEKW